MNHTFFLYFNEKRIRSLREGRAQANVLVKSYLLSAKDMP